MQLGPLRCLQTLVFYNRICFIFFRFSTPLVSFRVARIWLFVVVPVSLERCLNLQNRIFIFYCKTQGGQKWLLHSVETICDFLCSFFRPSQLLFVFFFVEAVCDILVCVFDPSRLFFVLFFFHFSTPLVYFPFFLFLRPQKCPCLSPAEKMNSYIFKRMVSSVVFFGRFGIRFRGVLLGRFLLFFICLSDIFIKHRSKSLFFICFSNILLPHLVFLCFFRMLF